MIQRIAPINITFKSYRQRFTDAEFQEQMKNSADWIRQNSENPSKRKINNLDKRVKKNYRFFEKYRTIIKKNNLDSHVELSIKDRELVGNVSYVNATPVEIRTEMPDNIKAFFKKIINTATAQKEEDNLKLKLSKLNEKERYLEACQRKRFKELSPTENKNPNPLLLYFDSYYSKLSEKLIEVTKEKDEIFIRLEKLKRHLTNKQFKLKLK